MQGRVLQLTVWSNSIALSFALLLEDILQTVQCERQNILDELFRVVSLPKKRYKLNILLVLPKPEEIAPIFTSKNKETALIP